MIRLACLYKKSEPWTSVSMNLSISKALLYFRLFTITGCALSSYSKSKRPTSNVYTFELLSRGKTGSSIMLGEPFTDDIFDLPVDNVG